MTTATAKIHKAIPDIKRIPTFIRGLDAHLEGGIPKDFIVLVTGAAGTMKSSVTFSIVHNVVRNLGKSAVYISLEQNRTSLLLHMRKLGMDIEDLENLVIFDWTVLRKDIRGFERSIDHQTWLNSLFTQIKNYVSELSGELLVIDSLSGLYALVDILNRRNELFHFFESLRELGLTTFLILEDNEEARDPCTQGIEAFLADGIIHMKTHQQERMMNLYMGVLKMRQTEHARGYFPLIVDRSGFEVVIE